MTPFSLAETLVEIRRRQWQRLDDERSVAEQVHLLRSTCKRLRALLALVGPGTPAVTELACELRRAHRSLAERRDRDVRAALLERALPSDTAPGARRAVRRARRWLDALPLAETPVLGREAADAGHRLHLEQLARRLERARCKPSSKRLHRLRQAIKAFVHQFEALDHPTPDAARPPLIGLLLELEDPLSQANDLCLLSGTRKARRKLRCRALRRAEAVAPLVGAALALAPPPVPSPEVPGPPDPRDLTEPG